MFRKENKHLPPFKDLAKKSLLEQAAENVAAKEHAGVTRVIKMYDEPHLTKNVHILTTKGVTSRIEMESKLNSAFKQGYSLSGGVTESNGTLYAVVVKPF